MTDTASIPRRVRVIAYLVSLTLGTIGTVNAAVLVWLSAEHWIDKPTDVMLAAVTVALLGLATVLCSTLALSHLPLPTGSTNVLSDAAIREDIKQVRATMREAVKGLGPDLTPTANHVDAADPTPAKKTTPRKPR